MARIDASGRRECLARPRGHRPYLIFVVAGTVGRGGACRRNSDQRHRPSEISTRYQRIEDVDAMLAITIVDIAPIPRAAVFLAGKAYLRYRAGGGARSGVLPDFVIGAHAAVQGWPILTRDVRRYRTYFAAVRLIAP